MYQFEKPILQIEDWMAWDFLHANGGRLLFNSSHIHTTKPLHKVMSLFLEYVRAASSWTSAGSRPQQPEYSTRKLYEAY